MTTIAYRDGILAADGRVTDGTHLIVTDQCRKIRRLSDGALFSLSGDDAIEERLVDWLENKEGAEAPPTGKDFTAVLVETDGRLLVYQGTQGTFVPWFDDFAAFGSGAEIAYGAMEMGASADEAVRVAARRNMSTGGLIQVMTPGHIDVEDTED